MATDFVSELEWRGLIHQTSDDAGVRKHLATQDPGSPRRAYVGFDPTANSFTVGNLVPMMLLARFQRAGHKPVVLAGGGTGLIGDPSGKSAERQLLTKEMVAANVEAQKLIFSRVIDFSRGTACGAELLNNVEWLASLSYIDALRDVGKYFSVNQMVQKDSVRDRLHNRDQGLSYTEFSYMILQAYDFLHLYEKHGVTIQMGGSDQWGNMTAGTDLIRKVFAARDLAAGRAEAAEQHAYVLTTPLFTKSDGSKFGKSESGAVWLSADRTSPFAFYQFWLNSQDADIPKLVKTFTLFDREATESLLAAHEKDPGSRDAHRALARHMTELLHGPTEAVHAETAAKALFSGDIAGLPEAMLTEVLSAVPRSAHTRSVVEGEGAAVLDLLISVQLAASKREAREFLATGSVMVNGRRAGPDDRVRFAELLHGKYAAIRRGKKQWHLAVFEG